MSMHYAPSLEKVSDIGNYDWGGAALACLYRSMYSCSRGRSASMGGYWRAWEVSIIELNVPKLQQVSVLKLLICVLVLCRYGLVSI